MMSNPKIIISKILKWNLLQIKFKKSQFIVEKALFKVAHLAFKCCMHSQDTTIEMICKWISSMSSFIKGRAP